MGPSLDNQMLTTNIDDLPRLYPRTKSIYTKIWCCCQGSSLGSHKYMCTQIWYLDKENSKSYQLTSMKCISCINSKPNILRMWIYTHIWCGCSDSRPSLHDHNVEFYPLNYNHQVSTFYDHSFEVRIQIKEHFTSWVQVSTNQCLAVSINANDMPILYPRNIFQNTLNSDGVSRNYIFQNTLNSDGVSRN